MMPRHMLTHDRFVIAALAACFVLGALPLAQAPAEEQSASQFYLSYRAIFMKARTIEELLPYMSKATRAQIESTPAAERPKMFEVVKAMNTYTSVKVVKETKTTEGVTLTVEAIDSDKAKATGTIEIVREDGSWKVGRERWSSSF